MELLATLRDTVDLAREVGVKYVWIDAICIVQDDDEDLDREGDKMHEYYGNAQFTLYIGNGLHSDESFLRERKAWTWRQLECDLSGFRLFNLDTSLDQARQMSPHATRAWTLQEEYLSPRRLYWYNQMMYWACAEEQYAEDIPDPSRRPQQTSSATHLTSRELSKLLDACFRKCREEAHELWLGIVESYTRRNLTVASDKFRALSGVASRYWQATRTSTSNDVYLSGLWLQTFAEELVWGLDKARDQTLRTETDKIAPPSWSWASLPAESAIKFQANFRPSAHFEVLKGREDVWCTNTRADADAHVAMGSQITSVRVQGRLRSFWVAGSRLVPWTDLTVAEAPGSEEISFAAHRDIDAYAVNAQDGRLAVAEAHSQEIVAHLDYMQDAQLIVDRNLNVICLDVGEAAMLLLTPLAIRGAYRRVGVCYYSHANFFDSDVLEEVVLQ